jgi:hypothetical protein
MPVVVTKVRCKAFSDWSNKGGIHDSFNRPLNEVNKPRLHAGLAIRCRYLIMPTGVIRTECVNKLKFYFYHVQIFYVKDITDKKVAGQNQEVEGHIAGCRLQRKPLTQSR